VRLQDGQGNLIEASPALPVMGWDDHLYYNRYPDDLMSGGTVYDQYSAYAWNRILGQRPVCGNYNSPCNIGEYLRDLPQANFLQILGQDDSPLSWARVEVHLPKSYPVIYGKLYVKEPDSVAYTDSQGRIALGSAPFGDLSSDIGPHRGVILLKISSAGQTVYRFFEITQANEAYWSGQHAAATYAVKTTLAQGAPQKRVFLPLITTEKPAVKPVFEYPLDGQVLDYDGWYLFKVQPIPDAQGYLWSFYQGGVLVWENQRDEGSLSSDNYGISPTSAAHSKFAPGSVQVWVRAKINNEWTGTRIITIILE
jgi:hypothetical protein